MRKSSIFPTNVFLQLPLRLAIEVKSDVFSLEKTGLNRLSGRRRTTVRIARKDSSSLSLPLSLFQRTLRTPIFFNLECGDLSATCRCPKSFGL
jgi:hypothetical protein